MLTPIYEADVIVLQIELEQRRDHELAEVIKSKQHEFSNRMRYLSRIVEEAPIDDTLKSK